MADSSLLTVQGLRTTFRTEDGLATAVDGISYTLNKGEVLGIVGESGSGKSVGALSLLRLIPSPPGQISGDAVRFKGRNLLEATRSRSSFRSR
jgi:ABC-type dipeptide/oligopeptide/nickel transport system ATPase component